MRRRHWTFCITISTLIGAVAGGAAAGPDIPPHPDEIVFPPLAFEPPKAADFRHTLSSGVPVYLAPSHEFPLINVVFSFKGADDLDGPQETGLAASTGAMIRRGGTTSILAEDLDEELDFLAAIASTSSRGTRSVATLNCLASNFDRSFTLFLQMLRSPGFQADRLAIYKQQVIEQLKQRNDHAASILSREWRSLLYGDNHFEAAQPTASSIESITEDGLRSMHRRIFHPGNLIVAVSGDFDPPRMLKRLEKGLAGWEAAAAVPDPPAPRATFVPGVYHVEKDIPQGRVSIGLRSIRRDHPDYFALIMANRILGGGGFTSRIVRRVRSDEGLAYSARSTFRPRVHYPGEFQASFQSKNRTVALAAKIIFQEIRRIRSEHVGTEELATAAGALIETFPRRFESKAGMLRLFVDDELTGRDPAFWQTYRNHVRAVTSDDIMRVAKKYLVPEEMAFLVVGRWDEIAAGDLEGRAQMSEFFGGIVTHLPLRDPLTLEPIE